MTQGADDLIGRHVGMRLRQRRQDLARPDLKINPFSIFGERLDAGGEKHSVAQVGDPIVGIGCFAVLDPIASPI